ncbi:MAG: hypothetical protein MUC95_09375, partial [Spirochaetes bacterium]|nr:hypothetical protein [Spirochaetota bacterium]
MIKKKNIYKDIIIAENVRGLINIPESKVKEAILSKDLEKDLSVHLSRNGVFYIVIFLHLDDLERVDLMFMNKYNTPNVFYRLVVFGNESRFDSLPTSLLHRVTEIRVTAISIVEYKLIVEKAFLQLERLYKHHSQLNEDMEKLIDMKRDQEDLINIGKALSTEKNFDELIKMILHLSKKITGA